MKKAVEKNRDQSIKDFDRSRPAYVAYPHENPPRAGTNGMTQTRVGVKLNGETRNFRASKSGICPNEGSLESPVGLVIHGEVSLTEKK
jgi:hypothetical protein